MARVVLDQVTKVFKGPKREKVFAVRDLSLSVQSQELLVLVGPSGSGKTTTLRLIAGLERPDQGRIRIGDDVVNKAPPGERDVAMVFQHHALFPHLTAVENLALGLTLRKTPRAEIESRVAEAAGLLGLTDCLQRYPKDLSGGERQRVALGRALVRRPRVFLLDEPLSHLDTPWRQQLRAEIARLHRRVGATMLYVTHDQMEAMTLGDRVAVMREGVVQQIGEPAHLYRHPANLFVAEFLGAPPMNFFRGTLSHDGATLTFQEENTGARPRESVVRAAVPEDLAVSLAGRTDKPVVLGLRPEHIWPARSLAEMKGESTVAARLDLVEPLGSETHLHLNTGEHAFIARVPEADKTSVGQTLSLVFDMRRAHFFDPASGAALLPSS